MSFTHLNQPQTDLNIDNTIGLQVFIVVLSAELVRVTGLACAFPGETYSGILRPALLHHPQLKSRNQ